MLQTKPVKSFSVTEAGILRQIAGDFNPDAIITYGGPETFLSRWLGLSTSCKILRFRGQELPPTRYFLDLKQRFALRSIDVTLTPSKAMAQEMRGRRLHSHIESVLLGCDTERFHRVSPGEPPRSQGRPELVIFGRFDPVKGHREFMQIFADLLDQCPVTIPRPFLHIVGQAANLSGTDLLHAAAACGLRQTDYRVTEERIENVSALMSRASIGVVSSLDSEVICRVAEEFLLCGTPVLVSGVGSLHEVLVDPSCGASYFDMSRSQAGEVIRSWAARSWSESEADKAARAALAKKHFSLEVMGDRLSQLISQIKGL
jgi:glycosyltransferase involved in cell wall biosynthesis